MSELLKRLRAAAQMLPPGATIGLPVEIIREALGAAAVEGATADLSVAQLAERFGRSRSTVRGWLEAGRFPGAYKLRSRDWRIPPTAIAAFREKGAGQVEAAPPARGSGRLDDWRNEQP